jgi:hypothetical protein
MIEMPRECHSQTQAQLNQSDFGIIYVAQTKKNSPSLQDTRKQIFKRPKKPNEIQCKARILGKHLRSAKMGSGAQR